MTRQSKLARIPTPIAGLVLALLSLSKLADYWLLPDSRIMSIIALSIAIPIIIVNLGKFIIQPQLFKAEINHPVLGSLLPTNSMALFMIANLLTPWLPNFAKLLWSAALLFHMFLLFYFIKTHVKHAELPQVIPSWLIPTVGILIAVVSFPADFPTGLRWLIFCSGVGSFIVLLPLITYRLLKLPALPAPIQGSFAIIAAPTSLVCVSYVGLSPTPYLPIVYALSSISIIYTCIVYLSLPKLVKPGFTPAWAALTFPLSISASARFAVLPLVTEPLLYKIFYSLAMLEMTLASIVTLWVGVKYVLFLRRL